MSELVVPCPCCRTAREKLSALIQELCNNDAVSVCGEDDKAIPLGPLHILCESCEETGLMLTDEGEAFLKALGPVLLAKIEEERKRAAEDNDDHPF